jgi:hypothetical protein
MRVLTNCEKQKNLVKIRFSPHPYILKDLTLMRKLTIHGTLEDESDGYRCNSSNDATSDGTLRRTFSGSMSEGTNEEINGEEEEERGDNENKRRNSCIPSKGRFVW